MPHISTIRYVFEDIIAESKRAVDNPPPKTCSSTESSASDDSFLDTEKVSFSKELDIKEIPKDLNYSLCINGHQRLSIFQAIASENPSEKLRINQSEMFIADVMTETSFMGKKIESSMISTPKGVLDFDTFDAWTESSFELID